MKVRAIVGTMLAICCLGLWAVSCKSSKSPKEQKAIMEAVQTQNTPELIKELITRMKGELETDNDRFPELIKEVETYADNCPDQASKAILLSMTAEMYKRYYEQNRWQINQRTAISGFIPEDIREWSGNLFTDKIKDQIRLSLQPAGVLQNTPVSNFQDILENGKDTNPLRPTLYDFLAQRAIQIQPDAETYEQWLAFRKGQDNKKAALLVELDYLKYTFNTNVNIQSRNTYEAALKELLRTYANEDFSTEIRIAMFEMIESSEYLYTNRDSIAAQKYALLKEGIEKFPAYERTNSLRNSLGQIEQPTMMVETGQTVYPGEKGSLKITYKNVQEIKVEVYESTRVPLDLISYTTEKEKAPGKRVNEFTVRLQPKNTYSTQDTVLSIPALNQTGLYECVVSVPGKKVKTDNTFSVSRLGAVHRSTENGGKEVLVTDFKSGKPITGATVNYFGGQRRDMKLMGKVQTDKNGFAVIPAQKDILAFQPVVTGDEYSRVTSIYMSGERDNQEIKEAVNVSLFTDRSIYRPGQTLYFKGIAWQLNKSQPQIAANRPFTVILRDANYKEITTKKFTSNAFGSFNGEFTLPKQGLNGNFTLSVGNFSTYFRVEEYKRPSFAVDIHPIKEEIAFGDKVTLQGKVNTFSGVALQEGKVEWRIVRRPFWVRMIGSDLQEEQVAQGSTSLSEDGKFSVSFVPEKSDNVFIIPQYQNYELTATVTDSKGETQESRYTFPVGDTSIILTVNMEERVEKTTADVMVSARLLNGEITKISGQYSIVTLTSSDEKEENNPTFTEGKVVASGSFTSDEALPKNVFSQLPSGRYRILLKAADKKGREVKGEQDFVLYSKEDKQPPVFSHTWIIRDKIAVQPGETAEWTFGTSDKEAYILYEVFKGSKRLFRNRLVLNNENHSFRLPYKEEYGDGVMAVMSFVKDGQLYVEQVGITRKKPDRSLTFRPETFRDRLLPGSEETWKFRIMDSDSAGVAAEVLAAMYDMSLDKIMPFGWYFSPERAVYLNSPWLSTGEGFGKNSQYDTENFSPLPTAKYEFDYLNWQGIMLNMLQDQVFYSMGAGNTRSQTRRMKASPAAAPEAVLAENQVESVTGSVDQDKSDENGLSQTESGVNSLRTNFNETAFFYPSLTTDKTGDVLIRFTIPESNTTWKLQAIAHTKDLKYGQMTKEVITSKPFMVLPNLPRFMRQGDEVAISTQIINQSDKVVTGKVRLEWFDPSTDKLIPSLNMELKTFAMKANEQITAQWTVRVPEGHDLLGCRIIADANEGSDGEQHLIPILSNMIMVTESTPFYLLPDKQEQNVQIRQPQNGRPYRMTLEVSGNPVWYAVQALPTINTPENDNILSWFASYYGNTLATSIANAHPKIQQIIRQWQAQGGDADGLLSNLEKNEELKNILLEETPWVLEAENETEQKQRLSLLFDMNRAKSQKEAALQQLLDQQQESGGWGWFKGFLPDRNMTLAILKGMSQLVELNAIQYDQDEKEMQMRALSYLDESIRKDYEALKKHAEWEKAVPSATSIDYLYVRSGYRDIPEPGDAREAIRFYTDQAEKNWEKLSLYGKAQVAILMHRNGKKETAGEIMAWLRKTATVSEEQGMYWANNRRGNDFFTSPIDVHCMILSAFNVIAPDSKETDRMKQWLLNQKRTQNWETVPATVNAIYAILLKGSDWLNENNTVTVNWNNRTYSTANGQTATGYLKEVITANEITPQSGNLTVRKTGNAPAWGAVYNQYFAPVDQVSSSKGVLNVEKKLFIETNNGTNREIRPVPDNGTLRRGDKAIVRLTLRTDRDMDYVYLKDLRAGCFEPAQQVSGTRYQDGIRFYQSPKDVSENFFIEHLPKGTFVVEYPVYVSRNGEYSAGISTIQCLYAPEFVSHTEGSKLFVRE